MKVKLLLEVSVHAFFPFINKLETEIAAGTYLTQNQVVLSGGGVRIQNQEKTAINVNLVPLGERFDNLTAALIYERFLRKTLFLNKTLFGDYEVVHIFYPGLPTSPLSGNHSGIRPTQDLLMTSDFVGRIQKLKGKIIFVISLAAVVLFIVCCAATSIIFKYRKTRSSSNAVGLGALSSDNPTSSTSAPVVSTMPTSVLSIKTFALAELNKATEKFSSKKVLGEGDFGRVYRGIMEDGAKIAVKLLNRENNQNEDREFISEVEILSGLHHRNLVKLIGICIERRTRCLVYGLVPNGCVESHLHGVDKQKGRLDWDTRLKIALGAARGLAYLHEDSNHRVIHHDFKASNVLLEDDFTPKVSDFGLAREATEGSHHISTRVMGTFGYIAPEYAMTGHLLVKSDVYSYGVVLLELLSGRKPVDMSRPPGEEHLVMWARTLLTTREGLHRLIDPHISRTYDFNAIVKVADIALMCVHPEVARRPYMGEVVQALKLVFNDKDDTTTQRDSSAVGSDLNGDPSDGSWWNHGSGMAQDYSSDPLDELENHGASLTIGLGNRSGPLRPVLRKLEFYRLKRSMSEHGGSRPVEAFLE